MRHGILILLVFCIAWPALAAEDELTGDTRLACEALLCLSSGGARPRECDPALNRYFSITRKKWSNTLKARKNFLELCPASSEPGMPSLVDAVVNGAGQCSAELLNRMLSKEITIIQCDDDGQYWLQDANNCHDELITIIDDRLPVYCKAYTTHDYVWKVGARYEGEKLHGGKWVDEQ